ncbi:hypothetical protein [Clostridium sp.]|uniref:hypothetical protein n=1 Tax=Clostridium sp. TaxID=1506 RepID=UPI001A4473E5|nr:hypothetical protein [Clostridium sp.]MBK5236694.1 hypothetical protein [Clostridium sp.]
MLRKDDPVYYKVKMKELIKSAHENGLEVGADNELGLTHIYFKSGIERAGVSIVSKKI